MHHTVQWVYRMKNETINHQSELFCTVCQADTVTFTRKSQGNNFVKEEWKQLGRKFLTVWTHLGSVRQRQPATPSRSAIGECSYTPTITRATFSHTVSGHVHVFTQCPWPLSSHNVPGHVFTQCSRPRPHTLALDTPWRNIPDHILTHFLWPSPHTLALAISSHTFSGHVLTLACRRDVHNLNCFKLKLCSWNVRDSGARTDKAVKKFGDYTNRKENDSVCNGIFMLLKATRVTDNVNSRLLLLCNKILNVRFLFLAMFKESPSQSFTASVSYCTWFPSFSIIPESWDLESDN